MISVICPVYNAEPYLREAIESIQKQTFTDWELVIVDDGSKDKSYAIAKEYAKKDKRLRVLQNKKNLGIGETMNRLVTEAKGEIIARMDADDIADPSRLELQYTFLNTHPDVAIVGSYMKEVDANSAVVALRTPPTDHEAIVRGMLNSMTIQNPTFMMRRSRIPETELYWDNAYSPVDDLEFFLRVARYVTFANVPEFLMTYRAHSSNATLHNVKRIFNLATSIRKKAMRQYGYIPHFRPLFIYYMQRLVIAALPEQWIYPLFRIWKGGRV